jgi:hypothetical protein
MPNRKHETRPFAFGDGTIGRRNICRDRRNVKQLAKPKTPGRSANVVEHLGNWSQFKIDGVTIYGEHCGLCP